MDALMALPIGSKAAPVLAFRPSVPRTKSASRAESAA
jgi:hypothetical protein